MKKLSLITIFVSLINISIGQEIPNWKKTDSKGNEYTLYDVLRKGNIVLLDFFELRCGPCRQAALKLEAIWNEYKTGQKGVYIFGMDGNWFETNEAINKFKKEQSITYPSFERCNEEVSYYNKKFGVNAIPFFVLIAPDTSDPANSTITYHSVGWSDQLPVEIKDQLDRINDIALLQNQEKAISPTKEKVSIFPNPNNGNFHIDYPNVCNKSASLVITDSQGKVVFTKNKLSSKNSIHLDNIAKGIYSLQIKSEVGTIREKIILE